MSDLRRELNQLWKTTIDQLDEIKDVIVKSSQAGKARLDAAMLKRERERLLAQLGEQILAATRAGDLSVPEPADSTIRSIRDLDEQIRAEEEAAERLGRKPSAPHSGAADEENRG